MRFIGTTDGAGLWAVLIQDDNGKRRALPLHLNVRNHSPTGFSWGYNGSGVAQLALAILLTVTTEPHALALYQVFKSEVLARKPIDKSWTMSAEEVAQWLATKEAEAINKITEDK